MNSFLANHATRRNILILIALMLIFEILFGLFLPKGEHARMIDTSFVTDGTAVYEIIENYDAGMRQAYIWGALTLDLIFPIVYMLLFGFLLYVVWKNTMLILLPLMQMIFDYMENASIVTMLSVWPSRLPDLATACVAFSLIKWALASIAILLILTGLIRSLIIRRRSSL